MVKSTRTLALAAASALMVAGLGAVPAQAGQGPRPAKAPYADCQAQGKAYGKTACDRGAVPNVINIDKLTVTNTNFRTAAWTTDDLQLTLMSIPVGGEVGLEMHDDVDQFLRVEEGTAKVYFGTTAEGVKLYKIAQAGDAILVPSSTWHNIVNASDTEPLKLYSLYGPQQHPQGTVHTTAQDDPHYGENAFTAVDGSVTPVPTFTTDPGEVPWVLDVEQSTLENDYFRAAAWSADDLQLTLMSIPVGGDVGLEMHDDVDQFLRVESGRAKVYFGDSEGNLKFFGMAKAGDAILVPSGTWHNIVNASPKDDLKLYSLYGPQQHPTGTIHETQADADH